MTAGDPGLGTKVGTGYKITRYLSDVAMPTPNPIKTAPLMRLTILPLAGDANQFLAASATIAYSKWMMTSNRL